MQQSQRHLPLGMQVRVVLMSYLTRPGLRWALLALLAGLACFVGAFQITYAQGRHSPSGNVLTSMLAAFGGIVTACGVAAIAIMILLHAHGQFLGTGAQTLPRTRKANLIVAAGLIVGLALLATVFAVWGAHVSVLGSFALWFGILILASYATLRPWLLPVMVVVGFGLLHYTTLSWKIDRFVSGYYEHRLSLDSDDFGEIAGKALLAGLSNDDAATMIAQRRLIQVLEADFRDQRNETLKMLRIVVIFAELLALVGLGGLAQPSRRSFRGLASRLRRPAAPAKRATVVREQTHTFIRSRFTRGLHRRLATHDWRAAGVAALAMSVLSLWFLLVFQIEIAAPMLTLMLAVLPGVLVAVGWRERWPTFEFESLYPVTREELITDMAAGLLVDVAEFWIASVIPVLLLCACVRTSTMKDPRFWSAIVSGGLMQMLWLAGIFLAGQRRHSASYIVGLAPVAVAMFLQFDLLWRMERPLTPRSMLLVSICEAGIGLAIFLMTCSFQKRVPRSSSVVHVQPAM